MANTRTSARLPTRISRFDLKPPFQRFQAAPIWAKLPRMKEARFEMRVDPDTLRAIDAFRRTEPDLPSRSEAVRRIIIRHVSKETAAQPRMSKDAWERSLSASYDSGEGLPFDES